MFFAVNASDDIASDIDLTAFVSITRPAIIAPIAIAPFTRFSGLTIDKAISDPANIATAPAINMRPFPASSNALPFKYDLTPFPKFVKNF